MQGGLMKSNTTTVSTIDFQTLTEKAKKISEKRSMLQAQEAALSKQVQDLQASLVQEYGENYMVQFNEAVQRIQQWDSAHAS